MFPKPEPPKETIPSPSKGKARKVSEDTESCSSLDSQYEDEAPKEKPKLTFSVKGYDDNENMWYDFGQ